ncbi:hypothetical protein AN946_03340 [Trueperella pyogenes]|nr:hypothetical protein AN946_03340 [Trueperella pyogenes]
MGEASCGGIPRAQHRRPRHLDRKSGRGRIAPTGPARASAGVAPCRSAADPLRPDRPARLDRK